MMMHTVYMASFTNEPLKMWNEELRANVLRNIPTAFGTLKLDKDLKTGHQRISGIKQHLDGLQSTLFRL
jgi:hypothetical protein